MVSTMLELMRDHSIPSLAVHDSLIVARSSTTAAEMVLKARFLSAQQEVQLTTHLKRLMVAAKGTGHIEGSLRGDIMDIVESESLCFRLA